MAKLELNSAMGGLRGEIDGWVYRQRNGQTEVAPHRPARKKKASADQLQRRERFRAAQAYAAEVLADPVKRLHYIKLAAAQQTPVNALLVSNFLTPPTIELIELSGYTGGKGQEIKLLATDRIEVTAVTVHLRDSNGTLLESGPATKDHGIWIYLTTTVAPANTAWTVEATARNRAGAETTQAAPR